MAIDLVGTPFSGGYNAAANSFSITKAPGLLEGELHCVVYMVSENTKTPVISGYQELGQEITTDSSWRMGVLVKVAGPSEPPTETMTFTPTGSTGLSYTTLRLSGVNTGDIFNSNPGVKIEMASATTTPSYTAGTLGLSGGAACLVLMGCEANRSVTSPLDDNLDYEISSEPSTNSLHVYLDREVSGTSNPQYDFTINSSRRMGLLAFELKAATTLPGTSVVDVTDPVVDTISVELSEAAPEVDTINLTYGGVVQSQSFTTEDSITFSITSVLRDLLPPTGTITVSLLDGVTPVVSTTTTLDDKSGWETTELVSPVTTPGSVFYQHTGATPVTGDKVRHNDPGNTTISPTGVLTQLVPKTVSVEAWDESDETYGTVGIWVWGVAKFANERWVAYLTTYKDVLATFGVDINTQVYRHLGSLGYTGLMPERLKQAKDDGVI